MTAISCDVKGCCCEAEHQLFLETYQRYAFLCGGHRVDFLLDYRADPELNPDGGTVAEAVAEKPQAGRGDRVRQVRSEDAGGKPEPAVPEPGV